MPPASSRSLSQLGLAKDHIYETILSTYNADATPTAAPIGIIPKGSATFLLRVFKETLTLKNLQRSRCGVVNFKTDPETFYRTAFKHTSGLSPLGARWFQKARKVKAPRLRSTEATIDFRVTKISDIDDLRSEVICKPERIDFQRTLPSAYCRGKFAAIECIIHATRIQQYLTEHRLGDAEKLITLVNHYKDLAERVSPGSKYVSIIRQICSQIDLWRRSN